MKVRYWFSLNNRKKVEQSFLKIYNSISAFKGMMMDRDALEVKSITASKMGNAICYVGSTECFNLLKITQMSELFFISLQSHTKHFSAQAVNDKICSVCFWYEWQYLETRPMNWMCLPRGLMCLMRDLNFNCSFQSKCRLRLFHAQNSGKQWKVKKDTADTTFHTIAVLTLVASFGCLVYWNPPLNSCVNFPLLAYLFFMSL